MSILASIPSNYFLVLVLYNTATTGATSFDLINVDKEEELKKELTEE
jgi:hypothetical protein